MKKLLILALASVLAICAGTAQPSAQQTPRYRIIIDNDFSGDPDGLFQLAHSLLSPSCEIRAIIGSHVGGTNSERRAVDEVNSLMKIMGMEGACPVFAGSPRGLVDSYTPAKSAGAQAIIDEAMRTDTKQRLFVLCGASLTTVASAYLMQPAIADKLTVIWIGGQEYEGMALPPDNITEVEYNLNLSIAAAQTVFNQSGIAIWQVPRNAYRQAIFSTAELKTKIESCGVTGKYLSDKLKPWLSFASSETYVLGDSPLVLLTALQTLFEPDAASSMFVMHPAPIITDKGLYIKNPKGREIRVYTLLDNRLMFDDMCAKLQLLARKTE